MTLFTINWPLWVFSFLISIISYYLWHWSYWIRRGIPGPRGFPVIGVANSTLSSDYPPFLKHRDFGKIYGSIFGITEGFMKSLVISGPLLVHEVFIKQFDNFYGRKLNPVQGDPEKDKTMNLFAAQGHRWKRLRTISAPTFSSGNLKKLKNTVEECSVELLKHIEDQTANREQIDIIRFYQEFTLDVIGRIAMGQEESRMFNNPLLPFVRAIFGENRKKVLMMGCTAPSFITSLFLWVLRKLKMQTPAIHVVRTVEKAVEKRMKERENDRKNGVEMREEPQDFIDLFLDVRSENEDELVGRDRNQTFSKSKTGKLQKQLTKEEVISQCVVFIIAGFDTTALSLSFSTYLLALNPDVMRKLQEEIDRECPDSEISYDQLSRLKYMEEVMKETLRLYPLAAPANSRKCKKDTVISNGKVSISIEKGTNVIANTWAIHRDPSIWGEDAEEFRPERWQETSEEHFIHKGGYIPFDWDHGSVLECDWPTWRRRFYSSICSGIITLR